LLLITSRKSHIGFQFTCKSSTLDDLEGHSQPIRLAILATAGFFCFSILLFPIAMFISIKISAYFSEIVQAEKHSSIPT